MSNCLSLLHKLTIFSLPFTINHIKIMAKVTTQIVLTNFLKLTLSWFTSLGPTDYNTKAMRVCKKIL